VISTSAQADTISWTFSEIVNIGGAQAETGTGFLDNSGTLEVAENSGGIALTFDGIAFAAGSFSYGASAAAFHADAPLTDTATFGTINNDPIFGLTEIGSAAGGFGVNIVDGQDYRVQLIIMDGRGNQVNRSIEIDGLATDHSLGVPRSWGNALLATGTFTGDATGSQTFTNVLFNNGSPRNDSQINAFAVHSITAVPEPSSLALLGLMATGMIASRRRKSA
jgi:hypothetical protein